MAVEPIAEQHATRQVVLARRTSIELGRLWRQVDRERIAASWRGLLSQAVTLLARSQAIAASSADTYVDDTLEAQDLDAAAAGRIVPGAFAGVASDGRPLATLLLQPAVTALRRIGAGATPAQAMTSGAFTLDLITRTQVADAGRTADGVAITSRPEVRGYVRMIVGATCADCLILAGRRYEWNDGFERHPRCDCRHIPVAESVPDDARVNPRAYFDSLTEDEQNELLGEADAEAVRAGADLAQVVNARRGMQTASVFGRTVQITTEGTTTRGVAGRRLGAFETGVKGDGRYRVARSPRLMPEQILREANGDRNEATRLLRRFGYIL